MYRRNYSTFFSVRLLSVLRGHSVFPSPPQRPMTSNFEGFSIPDFIHYIYFPILILEKEPVFSLFNVECQTRELLVPFLLRLWYDAFLVGGLNPGPPALEASTLLLGYRGGGYFNYETIQRGECKMVLSAIELNNQNSSVFTDQFVHLHILSNLTGNKVVKFCLCFYPVMKFVTVC